MRALLLFLMMTAPCGAITITAAAGGGNWSSTTSWSPAQTPTAADDVVLASTSGSVTVDTTTCLAKSVSCTASGNYAGTLNFLSGKKLTVSGSVIFASTMTLVGTGNLTVNGSGTMTNSATGNIFPGDLTMLSPAVTITMGSNWSITGTLQPSQSNGYLSGNAITCMSNMNTVNNITGTTVLVFGGSGAVSTGYNGWLSLPIQINTSGTVTFGPAFSYSYPTAGNSITYIAGGVNLTAFNNTTQINLTKTLPNLPVHWNNLAILGDAGNQITLTGPLNVDGDLTFTEERVDNAHSTTIVGNYDITCSNLVISQCAKVNFVSGRSVSITNSFLCSGNLGSYWSLGTQRGGTMLIRSTVTSSPVSFVYTGTPANCKVFEGVFQDVDASRGYPIFNYDGGTLTNTANILNVNLPLPIGGWGSW